jgi:hypothetical protein
MSVLYVDNDPILFTDLLGLTAQMCTKILPYFHTYLCVDNDCGGKNPMGNIFWSPGQIEDDSSKKNSPLSVCNDQKDEGHQQCFEKCIKKKIDSKGPSGDSYDVIFDNCIQWAAVVLAQCSSQCAN